MRKAFLVTFLTLSQLFLSLSLSAQQVSDLSDRLYTDLSLWQEQGIISNLPPLRPYPMQLVETLLQQVQARGDADARQRATVYLKDFGKLLSCTAASRPRRELIQPASTSNMFLWSIPGMVTPSISYSGDLGIAASNGTGERVAAGICASKRRCDI